MRLNGPVLRNGAVLGRGAVHFNGATGLEWGTWNGLPGNPEGSLELQPATCNAVLPLVAP